VTALLLLAACGGDDDDDDGGDSDGATATEQADGDDDTASPDAGDDDGDGEDGEATPAGDDDDDDEATPAGDDDDDDSGDAAYNPCDLMTTEEAGQALGLDVAEGEFTDNDPFYECDWEAASEFEVGSLSVEILTGDDDSREYYYELTTDADEIDGLGERAQFDDLIGLEVILDDINLNISMINFELEDDEVKTRSVALAELLLDRIE
jgi:hypothetical protein